MSVEWTPERIDLLTELWNAGLPTGEIGRRLGVTKNAVVGKVHRLGLPKRPSPIKKNGQQKAKKPAKPAPKPKIVTLSSLKGGMCSWPLGDPGTPEFRFCGKPSIPGKPYCADHCAVAYVRGSKDRDRDRDRETEAA